MNFRRISLLLLMIGCGTGWQTFAPKFARAQTSSQSQKAEARRHFDAGVALMEAEDWQGATREFEASVRLHANAANLFNLANTYKAVHRYGEALATLKRLRTEQGTKLRPAMAKDASSMKRDIEAIVARVSLRVETANAKVRVDGRLLASRDLDESLVLGPGVHKIQVTADGFAGEERVLDLVSGQSVTATFSLKPMLGVVSVETVPAGATVTVDGEPHGTTPIHPGLSLRAGEHTILLSKDGYEPASRVVALRAGGNVSLHVTLPRASAPPGTPIAPTTAPPSQPPEVDHGPSESGGSALPWVTLAGTVLAGAGAGVSWAVAANHADDFETYDNWYADPTVTDPNEIATYRDKRSDAADDTRKFSTLAIGCGVAAGVLAVTTVVLFATSTDEKPAVAARESGDYSLRIRF
jgi:PEGA domain